VEHLLIEEEDRAEGLVLGWGSYILVHGQMGEELFDFCCFHLLWMLFVVKEDEALDPIDAGFFGADGVSDTSTSSVQARSSSFFSRRFVMIPPTCVFRFAVVR